MNRKILSVIATILLVSTSIPSAHAVSSVAQVLYISASNEGETIPFADVIVYKYRIYNGKRQYRRWNETRGYWVDPYWIDVPRQNSI